MFKKFICIILLVFTINCGVSEVHQTQLWYDDQLVNHNEPLNNSTYSQRYWMIDEFYEPETGPVILYICGEYTCPGLPEDRLWPADIAQMYGGLILVLEHRYYGESMPFGKKSLELEYLNLLTVDQALADLSQFIQWVKQTGQHGVSESSPWFTIGGSYPGAMSAWFRYKYPHLTVGAIASSAVINAILDFTQFDEQMRISAEKSGDWCAQAIHDLNFNAQKQVSNPLTSQNYKKLFGGEHVSNDQFMFFYADIFVGKIQYGERTWLCDNLKDKTLEQNTEFIVNLAKEDNLTVDEYSSYYLKNDTYDVNNLQSSRQWTYQYCSEFGWFQTAPKPYDKSLRGTLVDLDMYSGLCSQSFENQNIWPDVERVNLEYGATDMEAFNIILTNGDEDPWKWASLLENKNQMMAIEIECTNCAHCVDLYTPREDDAQTLKNARKVEIQEISRWIQEYNEKNGYNFRTTPKKEFSILDNPNTQEIQ